MKTTINKFLILFFALLTASSAFGLKQDKKVVKTAFKVSGTCGFCEKRIEMAAQIKGVKYAEWDKHTKVLEVFYKPSQTDEESIHEAVAEAGHDTEKVKASDRSYEKLPSCCAYRDGAHVH